LLLISRIDFKRRRIAGRLPIGQTTFECCDQSNDYWHQTAANHYSAPNHSALTTHCPASHAGRSGQSADQCAASTMVLASAASEGSRATSCCAARSHTTTLPSSEPAATRYPPEISAATATDQMAAVLPRSVAIWPPVWLSQTRTWLSPWPVTNERLSGVKAA